MIKFSDTFKSNYKTFAMPVAMIIGVLLYRPIGAVDAFLDHHTTPMLLSLMLFVSCCGVDMRKLRLSWVHPALLVAQAVLTMGSYVISLPFGEVVAQGVMVCAATPIAIGAIVICGLLGANIVDVVTFSLISNIVAALTLPFVLSYVGDGSCTMVDILSQILPLLILPMLLSQILRALFSRVAGWFERHSFISFNLWLTMVMVVFARTTIFVLDSFYSVESYVFVSLACGSLLLCLVQFAVGAVIGRKFGDQVLGTQSLGQKNTVFAVWMSQSFLIPLSSIAPVCYIVWQNLVNSTQIYIREHSQR